MHIEQTKFVMRAKSLFPDYFRNCSVIEIGSANINGSIRWLFNSCYYIGVDIWEGKDVDIIWQQDFAFEAPADTYISCECFEHDLNWDATLDAMVKSARNCLILTFASTGRPEHGTRATTPECSPYTTDYYRNLTYEDIAPHVARMPFKWHWYNQDSKDMYFIGFWKTPAFKPSLIRYIWLEIKLFSKMRLKDNINGVKKIINRLKSFVKQPSYQ